MCKACNNRFAVILLCLVTAFAGCGGPAEPKPRTDALNPELPPLPAEALLSFEQVPPALEKPANPQAPPLPEQALPYVSDGEKLIVQQQWAQAVQKLERAAAYAPQHPRILQALGLAYAELHNYGKAMDLLGRSLEAAPDNLIARVYMGQLYAAQNRQDEALRQFRLALLCTGADSSSPAAAEALRNTIVMLADGGYYTAALEANTKLIEWIETDGNRYLVSPHLRAILLRPEQLLTSKGDLLLKLRRPADARQALEVSFERDRSNTQTARLLVDALIEARDYATAERLIAELSGETDAQRHVIELARRLIREAGDSAMPGRIWQASTKRGPLQGDLAAALAEEAAELGAMDEAEQILVSLVETMPGNAPALRSLASMHAQRGKADKALSMLAKLLASDPQSADAVADGVSRVAAAELDEGYERQYAESLADDATAEQRFVAAVLAQHRNKPLLAAQQYEIAIERRDDFFAAYDALLDIYLRQRRMDQAQRLLEQSREADLPTWTAEYLNAKIMMASGQFEAAATTLEAARRQNRAHVPLLLMLADAYARAKKYDEAADTLRAALDFDNDNEQIFRSLFNLYASRRQYIPAETVAAALEQRHGATAAVRLMKCELMLIRGQRDQAKQIVDELLAEQPDNTDAKLLALRVEVATESGVLPKEDYEKAVARLAEIIRHEPYNPAAKRMLAELLSQPGQDDEAAAVLGRLYHQTDKQADIGAAYAFMLMRAKSYDQAVLVLDELLQAEGDDRMSLRDTLLEALRQSGRVDEATVRLEQWLQQETLEPQRLQYRQRLLHLYRVSKQYDKGLELLDRWIASTSDTQLSDVLKITKLRFYCLGGQYDAAVDFCRQFVPTLDAQQREGLQGMFAKMLADAEQYDTAERLLDEWIEGKTDESVSNLRQLRLAVVGKSGQTDRAVAETQAWIDEIEGDALAQRQLLVGILVDAEQYDHALERLDAWLRDAAAQTQPTQPVEPSELVAWARQTAIRVLLMQRLHDAAIARADDYLADQPRSVQLMTLKAMALGESDRRGEAMKLMEQALDISPDDIALNNDLGYMYAEMGVNLDKAERMVRLALAKAPGNIAFIDSLAWVFYKQNRMREASMLFEQALQQRQAADDPEQAEEMFPAVILDHAGDVFWRLGWKDRAVELWREAVERAGKEKRPATDTLGVLKTTPLKVADAEAGRSPQVAPLGEGIRSQ